jgi:UPF0755 protein
MSNRPERKPSSAKKRASGKPPGKRAASGMSKPLLWSALAVPVAALLALMLASRFVKAGGIGSTRVEITLTGDDDVAALEQANVIASALLTRVYFAVTSVHPAQGAHLVSDGLSLHELAEHLERSGPKQRVTFPEGITRFEMGKRLEAAGICSKRAFVEASQSAELLLEFRITGSSLEGFLFPATYDFPKDTRSADVVRRLKGEFDKRWSALESAHASSRIEIAKSLSFGTREFVTLASLVEKEAVVDDERATVASVFVNRLRDPSATRKLLQCDPTGMYGCTLMQEGLLAMSPGCVKYAGKATHDVNVDAANPYSSYTHDGLPPGPIANPGQKSLAAALEPNATPYLYFVAKGQGRHTFSETYSAHEQAVHREKP